MIVFYIEVAILHPTNTPDAVVPPSLRIFALAFPAQEQLNLVLKTLTGKKLSR